jgi:tRNA-intron lyase
MSKLDFMETIFLSKHFGIEVINNETGKKTTPDQVLEEVASKREYARQLYEVYEDWRLKSYVVKTGFKFGSHFRIYFPGASPVKQDKWIHSRHVLHVFPKEQKMLISEWSRAVRVAHGVKKTFILGIPKLKEKDYIDYPADFMTYRRKKGQGVWVRETPKDKPRYMLVAVSEDEHIGGVELASMLKKAKDTGLNLLLSITDRETSITYYELKKIILPKSRQEYYEIEWFKP